MDKTAAEKRIIASHPKDTSMYKLSRTSENNYIIKNTKRETSYQMVIINEEKRICTKEYCKLQCERCNNEICSHAFKCSCPKYRFDMHCVHLHVLSMELSKGGRQITDQVEEVDDKVGYSDVLETLKTGEQRIKEETQEQVLTSQLKSFLNAIIHKADSEEKTAFMSKLTSAIKDIKVPMELVQAQDKNPSGMKVVNYAYNKPGRKKDPKSYRKLPSAIVQIIKEGLIDGKDDKTWHKVLNIPKESLLSQVGLPSQQLPQFEKEYNIAKDWWFCHICKEFELPDINSGYIECAGKIVDEHSNQVWFMLDIIFRL